MTISTATTAQASQLLRERDITVAGVVVAALKMSVQQALGEMGGEIGRGLVSASGGMLPGTDGLTAAAHTLDAWTCGLAGLVLLLILPLGGPVWAGVVPVGTTVSGVRRAVAWTRVRVNRNVSAPGGTHDGFVPFTLLIVDDSASFRELAERILSRDGFTVVGTAATGAEALAGVASLRPQVALVDVNLGAESGFDLARKLTAPGAPPLTVVLMSTHSADTLADLIAQSPAAGFVPKERLSGAAVRDLVADAG